MPDLERWPGYTEQSWHERFAEMDRRYQSASQRLLALCGTMAGMTAELARVKRNRDMWKAQCERQADELRGIRAGRKEQG